MAKPWIRVSRLQMDTISCKLCNKIYQNPQILNCLHSFCATCLQQKISQDNYAENKLLCPLCKECTYVEDGVENLPYNTMLVRFIAQAQHEELLLVCDRVISEDIHDPEKERLQSEEGVEDSHCHEIKHQSGNDLNQSKCAENQSDKESSQPQQGMEGTCSLEIKHQSGNDLDQSKYAENQSDKESSQPQQDMEGSHSLETNHQSGNDFYQSKCSEKKSENETSQYEQSKEGSNSPETKHQSGNDLYKSKCAENQSDNSLDQSKSVENQSGVTSDSNSCLDGDFHSNSFLSDSLEIKVSEDGSDTRSVFSWNAFPLVSLSENTEDVLRNQERKKAIEAMELRENVKTLVTNLQETALGVVYALESINLSYHEWLDNRENVKRAIKERSMHLQKMIKCQERKLLSTVEDNIIENNMKDEMTNSKDQLQGVLRGTLNATEFLKLLIEFGNGTDFLTLQDIIKARANHLSNPNIQLRRQKFTFKPPMKDSDNFIDEAFGQLKEESSIQSVELNTKQTINCENMTINPSADAADYDNKHFPLPLSDQLQAQYSDESYGYNHHGLQYITIDDRSNSASEDDPSTKSYAEKSSDVISGHKSKTSTSRCRRRMSFNDISSRVQNIASKKLQTRRISVPANDSSITSNISKRRFCALSLLMRSKSQEEGTPSELETNANIAQLEWIRENIRKKTLSRQSSQPES
ncbi:hypothetical protein CHS0354_015103 [Potamilus streckersoni]|uniref:RING-type domain-containing protein n=1 Tax=Potamilus streckersoni TaxID=2493646 RepID=A0AAE0TIB7_9BIVA|nr:hypothetical protein CHS0354_015103 [Potamilus streckersoni]